MDKPEAAALQRSSQQRLSRGVRLQAGAIAVVDNSMLAPIFAQPLSLGADICMTSATKFIGGHSDITAGILSVKDPALAERIAFVQAQPAARTRC